MLWNTHTNSVMDAVKGMPFDCVDVPIRVHENGGGFDADDFSVDDETMSSAEEMSLPMSIPVNSQSPQAFRTSELTISFEGHVYVFPAVTTEKVFVFYLLLFCCIFLFPPLFVCRSVFSISMLVPGLYSVSLTASVLLFSK